MIRRPPRSTLSSSSAASDVYKRQVSTQSTGDNNVMGPTFPSSSSVGGGVAMSHLVEAWGGGDNNGGGNKKSAHIFAAGEVLCGLLAPISMPVSYTHLRAHETPEHLVCRLLLEKKKH
eukprot:TRINITY_DN61802_c0_g1_i1.p1 TRINITY_DN61802_c0_g1~~TRINITY_DN61802_c0_g1_i1.p1  ORF type:complete len:118 (+),score=45.58 TRINITY_DN61802_c0_g1_i1:62-415(+)